MKKLIKERLWVALKAAFWGALIFVGLNLLVFFGDNVLGWTSGAGISFPGIVVAILPYFATQMFGLNIAISHEFVLLVNTLAGACLFFVVALIWGFCANGKNENNL